MNRPKRASRNQDWSSQQTGRPPACLEAADCPEAGSAAPGSIAGYLHRPTAATAAAPKRRGPNEG